MKQFLKDIIITLMPTNWFRFTLTVILVFGLMYLLTEIL